MSSRWHIKTWICTSSQRSSKATFISTFKTSDSTSFRQFSSSWTWVLRSSSGCSGFTFILSGLQSAARHESHNYRLKTNKYRAKNVWTVQSFYLCLYCISCIFVKCIISSLAFGTSNRSVGLLTNKFAKTLKKNPEDTCTMWGNLPSPWRTLLWHQSLAHLP